MTTNPRPDKSGNLCDYWPVNAQDPPVRRKYGTISWYAASDEERRKFKFDYLAQGGTAAGFRLYKTICPECPAHKRCIEVRINADRFQQNKKQQKKSDRFKAMADISAVSIEELKPGFITDMRNEPPLLARQIYKLYSNYHKTRHGHAAPDIKDAFAKMLENNSIAYVARHKTSGQIIAAAFTDQHNGDVHSDVIVYDMDETIMKSSPGTAMLLHIAGSLPSGGNFYLGSWSPESPKLGYKIGFQNNGLEFFHDGIWNKSPPLQAGICGQQPHAAIT